MNSFVDNQRREELREIAYEWAHSQIDSWLYEYGAWDMLIEDEELNEEELNYLRENFKYSITVEDV